MATAIIGHNAPPDTFTAFSLHIDDLEEQARQFLDGEPIATEAQAEDVSRLLNMIRKAGNDADDARKAEKKPFDDQAKAVQAKWKPVLDRVDLVASVAKQALAPFLKAKEDAQRAEAEAARKAADDLLRRAREAASQANASDLAGQATARILQDKAAAAGKQAAKLDKAKAHAKGGERAVGLVSVFTPELVSPSEALKHYREAQPEALKAWLIEQAEKDIRAGKRSIPGFDIREERVAR